MYNLCYKYIQYGKEAKCGQFGKKIKEEAGCPSFIESLSFLPASQFSYGL